MIKSIKYILLPLVLFSLLFTGCDDLFSTGDTEKTYDGPDQVAFYPLQTVADEGTTASIEVQLITADGLASSDVTVNISVDASSTADADDYTLSSNSVTISSGTASSTFTVTLNTNGDTEDEELLILNLSADGVAVAENLKTARIFIENNE